MVPGDPALADQMQQISQLVARQGDVDSELQLQRRAAADITRLEAAARAAGYYDAKLSYDIDKQRKPWRVTVKVALGAPYRLREVKVIAPGGGVPPGAERFNPAGYRPRDRDAGAIRRDPRRRGQAAALLHDTRLASGQGHGPSGGDRSRRSKHACHLHRRSRARPRLRQNRNQRADIGEPRLHREAPRLEAGRALRQPQGRFDAADADQRATSSPPSA